MKDIIIRMYAGQMMTGIKPKMKIIIVQSCEALGQKAYMLFYDRISTPKLPESSTTILSNQPIDMMVMSFF